MCGRAAERAPSMCEFDAFTAIAMDEGSQRERRNRAVRTTTLERRPSDELRVAVCFFAAAYA